MAEDSKGREVALPFVEAAAPGYPVLLDQHPDGRATELAGRAGDMGFHDALPRGIDSAWPQS